MSWNAAEPLGKPSGIAVVATCTDLGASGDRVPRRVGPLDRAVLRHGYPQIRAESLHVIFPKEKPPEILSRASGFCASPLFPRARATWHASVRTTSSGAPPSEESNQSSRDGNGCSIPTARCWLVK